MPEMIKIYEKSNKKYLGKKPKFKDQKATISKLIVAKENIKTYQ